MSRSGKGRMRLELRDVQRQHEAARFPEESMVRDTCARCERFLPRRYLWSHAGDLHCDVCLHALGARRLRFVRAHPDQWVLYVLEGIWVAEISHDMFTDLFDLTVMPPRTDTEYAGRFDSLEAAARRGVDWAAARFDDLHRRRA